MIVEVFFALLHRITLCNRRMNLTQHIEALSICQSATYRKQKKRKSCVVVVRKSPPKKTFPYTQLLCKAKPYLDRQKQKRT